MIKALAFGVSAAMVAMPAYGVYRCEVVGASPTFQDEPCATGKSTRIGIDSPREAADRAAADAAKEKEQLEKKRIADEESKKEVARIEKDLHADRVQKAVEAEQKWQDAKWNVRPGMTWAQVEALSLRFNGGRHQTTNSPYGRDEWIYLDEDRMALHLHNGVVAFVQRN
jgi:hypothetical protein